MKKEILKLCGEIKMPQELMIQMEKVYSQVEWEKYCPQFEDILNFEGISEAISNIKRELSDDENGIKMLIVILYAALQSWEKYEEKSISRQVYLDTFGCLSRFVKEHFQSYGIYGFDREWWVARQLSLIEFRIGELEYEMVFDKELTYLDIHIPSDANLSFLEVKESLIQAKKFFANSLFQYMRCDSWLLSPKLKEFLPCESKIIQFQKLFDIKRYDPNNESFMEWVFKNSKMEVRNLPETTSLQRKIKIALLNNEKIGSAFGILKKEILEN